MKLLPIPGLHSINLGPVNLLLKFLGNEVNVEKFEQKHSLLKMSYHGGHWPVYWTIL